MSINDLLDSELFFPALIIVFILFLALCVPAWLTKFNQTNNAIFGDDENCAISEEKGAKIIACRKSPHPLLQSATINVVIFELANGNRVELAIKDLHACNVMVEGDCGTLTYQGKKYINFEKDI